MMRPLLLVAMLLPVFIIIAGDDAAAQSGKSKRKAKNFQRTNVAKTDEFEVTPPRSFSSRFGLGVGLGSPEVVYFDASHQISGRWRTRVLLAPQTLSFDIPFEISSYETSGALFQFASEAKHLTATVQYGPHFAWDAILFPWGPKTYLLGGFGVRKITAYIDDSISFGLCRANASSCDRSADLDVVGQATSTTMLLRTGFGFEWRLGESGFINLLALGISLPVSHSLDSNIDVSLDSNLPSWATDVVNTGLNRAVDAYEDEIGEALYQAYAAEYDAIPLPLAGLSFGYFF